MQLYCGILCWSSEMFIWCFASIGKGLCKVKKQSEACNAWKIEKWFIADNLTSKTSWLFMLKDIYIYLGSFLISSKCWCPQAKKGENIFFPNYCFFGGLLKDLEYHCQGQYIIFSECFSMWHVLCEHSCSSCYYNLMNNPALLISSYKENM